MSSRGVSLNPNNTSLKVGIKTGNVFMNSGVVINNSRISASYNIELLS